MYKIANAMTSDVITIRSDKTLAEAVLMFVDNYITGLPVVDDNNRLCGIISEKDVIRLLYQVDNMNDLVANHMTKDVVSFDYDRDNLIDIVNCLREKNFRRVPITRNGKLVGIISRKDIIAYILKIRQMGEIEMALNTICSR